MRWPRLPRAHPGPCCWRGRRGSARTREELLAAGGRPRRSRIGGGEELTASELRGGRRAALGCTNRQIAQELFVTIKAVEKHLASSYRKLSIQGRAELAEALSPAAA